MEDNKPCPSFNFAQLDHDRSQRNGFMEVIYSPGKDPHHLAQIFHELYQKHGRALATRANPEQYEAVLALLPTTRFYALASLIYLGFDLEENQPNYKHPIPVATNDSPCLTNIYSTNGSNNINSDTCESNPKKINFNIKTIEYPQKKVGLISAGTADLAVAEETYASLAFAGIRAERFYDIGVAGLHRLLDRVDLIKQMDVLIVVAGMDGALPSVVAGLVSQPIISVPTSVGYGANFQGLAPLLTMLNSCAAGVTVVNIDNGYGAAMAAVRILNLSS